MKEWNPDQAINDLTAERDLDGGNDLVASERIFSENAIPAALSIAHMAIHSGNERIRLEAAKYVVDRNLGRIGDADPLKAAGNDPILKFLKSVSVQN
jgi:hypothetical protein